LKAIVYSTKDFERGFLAAAAKRHDHTLRFEEATLSSDTADRSAGYDTAIVFAGDDASAPVIERLGAVGVQYVAIRAAGYDNVDLEKAHALGIRVANVPAYSPYAIAEHAVALILALNRKLIIADKQVHAYNFTVGNLVGFDLHGKTVGVIGTGTIGSVAARILHGFGCVLVACDIRENEALKASLELQYCDLAALCRQSDIITLHTDLNNGTRHLINASVIDQFRPGTMLINTSRGAIVHTPDVINGLKHGQIGAYGGDVYEHEKGVFFCDRSQDRPNDVLLEELLAMPNVLLTPHQAFATREALGNIAETTAFNLSCWETGQRSPNEL
jgi:D-lactate dehydrogenase